MKLFSFTAPAMAGAVPKPGVRDVTQVSHMGGRNSFT